MKTKNKIRVAPGSRIKIQVNSKTIIYVRTQDALDAWMDKYPEAKIVG